MNKLLIILLLMSFGCRSTKHIVKSDTKANVEAKYVQQSSSSETVKTANDLNVETTTVTVETNYFNPDSVKTVITENGVVKSTKITTTKIKQVDKSKVEQVKQDQVKTNNTVKDKTITKQNTVDKKTVPIQWWAIFGILLIILIGIIYFKGINIKGIINNLIK